MLFNKNEDEYNNKNDIEKSEELFKSEPEVNNTKNEEHFFEGAERETKSHYYEKYKDEKSRKYSFKKVMAACLVVSLVGGGSIGAGYSLTEKYVIPSISSKTDIPSEVTNTNGDASAEAFSNASKGTALSYSSVDIVSNVMPSVVSINTKSKVTQNSIFGGYSVPYEASGAGSGVIYSEDDTKIYIATNEHVISGASEITVSLEDKDSVPATVIGSDKTSDLAVISVLKSDLKSKGISAYKVAKLGDSDSLEMGQNVIAIGNALGEGKTATGGMISAKGKTIDIDGKKLAVIQTDAAINPGNSGGALVNYNGEVVGINTAKAFESSVEGMGYAIPSNVLKPIIQKLIENGSVPRPYLGIVGSTVTDELGKLYGLPIGVVVTQVMEGGSADKAGIQSGDIITDFAGEKVLAMDKLVELLAKQEVGKQVEVRIIRDGKEAVTKTITIQDANLASEN